MASDDKLNTANNIGVGGISQFGKNDDPNVFKSVPKLRDPSVDHIIPPPGTHASPANHLHLIDMKNSPRIMQ
jgi:hypothetical protein